MDEELSLIIIGGGVAACTAGMFAGRRGLTTLLLAKDLGGQTASTSEIDNYPGVGRIEGPHLIQLFADQARSVGSRFLFHEVVGIAHDGDMFTVQTAHSAYRSDAVICAFGKTPKSLMIQGEERFIGRGLHYCNSYDVDQYRDTTVAVVGGGNSALGLVRRLAPIARRIYLIHRRDEFRAEQILCEYLETIPNCEKKIHSIVTELHGNDCLNSITVRDMHTQTEERLEVEGLFIGIGFESRSDVFREFIQCDSAGRILIDQQCKTSREGVFAAGDCTTTPYQQIVISAGEGAKAAISAYQYISKKKGTRSLQVDWGFIQ